MTQVISDVDSYITANSGDSGRDVYDGVSPPHKRHQVKHAINILLENGDIAETPAGNGRWYDNTYAPV